MNKDGFNAAGGPFRNWIRRIVGDMIQSQVPDQGERILEKLQDIEEQIEILAREIARQCKKRK